jgi:hypothetical protein
MTTNYYLDSRDEVVAFDYNGLQILCPIIGVLSQGIEGKTYTKTYTQQLTTTTNGIVAAIAFPFVPSASYNIWYVINAFCLLGPDVNNSFHQQTQTRVTVSNVGVATIVGYQNIFSGSIGYGVGQSVSADGAGNIHLNIQGNNTDTWRFTVDAVVSFNEAV